MSETSPYQRFAWIAKYIVRIRPSDQILEFEFPPHTAGTRETIEYLIGMKLPWFDVAKKTIWGCTISNEELFRFLRAEQLRVGLYFCHPEYNPKAEYTDHFVSGELLEDAGFEDIYLESIKFMTDDRLKEQLACAIALEHYEHAALIRDEIKKREDALNKLPFLQPLKWRP